MYEQAESVRSPFSISGPCSGQTSGPPPQPPPVHQSGWCGRGASYELREENEAVKRDATAGSRRCCMTAGIAVLLSLLVVGLASLTFINKKRDKDDMSTTVDALTRDQDDMRQLSSTVDALKRDLDKERIRTTALEQRLREISNFCASNPCQHDGTCRDEPLGYTCECREGWRGRNCEEFIGKDYRPCPTNPCENDGHCIMAPEGFRCLCYRGWAGTYCEKVFLGENVEVDWQLGESITRGNWSAGDEANLIQDCRQSASFPFRTYNQCNRPGDGGQAISNEETHSGNFSWHFKRGYSSRGGGTPFSTGLNTWAGRKDGQYSAGADSFYASFFFKLANDRLDESKIAVVAGNPHGDERASNYLEIFAESEPRPGAPFRGLHVRVAESYPNYTYCSVTKNYIDECASSPCLNSAACSDLVNSYRCECPGGYTGQHCGIEIDECESNPCQNRGRCRDRVNGYACICPYGWIGAVCNISNFCASSPCQNDRRCVERSPGYRCVCQEGWRGKNCEEYIFFLGSNVEVDWQLGESITRGHWSAGRESRLLEDCEQPDRFPFPTINDCQEPSDGGQAISNEAAHSGNFSWHFKRGYTSKEQGTPFSTGLNNWIGRTDGNYSGDADSFYASFFFKLASDRLDDSKIAVVAGNPDGDARASNYLEIYADQTQGLRVRVQDSIFGRLASVAENLDPVAWHRVEMTLHARPGSNHDAWHYAVDQKFTFSGSGYFQTENYKNDWLYEYVNRLKFQPTHENRKRKCQGFFFDDVYYKAFNVEDESVTIEEYGTSFESYPLPEHK
ncbi:NOTCH1 [Branchiostoma lanceolatum]|uniref:NOTCH1 protein n=1 Tax=Branchiostoma lanceolatum TaxID=7740 RepID=A0A8J9Z7Z8_BRALA|nr:NOTCH1 [Branchiostoma lanceolatum]